MRLVLWLVILGLTAGCTSQSRPPLAVSKDEFYRFEFGSLSLGGYDALKRRFSDLPPKNLFRLSQAALWLSHERSLSLDESTRCVLRWFRPQSSEPACTLSDLSILHAEFLKKEALWSIEWNRSALQEYGIPP